MYPLFRPALLLLAGNVGGLKMKNGQMSDEKRRRLRWMEMMWERQRTITHEEKRKQEVLEIFRDLVEFSERLLLPRRR